MTVVLDFVKARIARINGEKSVCFPVEHPEKSNADFRVGDKVKFKNGAQGDKTGTILCFGASSIRGPLMALVSVNGLNYTCPTTELRHI